MDKGLQKTSCESEVSYSSGFYIQDCMLRFGNRPIAALIAGVHAKHGRVMGHAGAWAAPGEASAEAKHKALQDVGVTMVNHPAKFGHAMKRLLDGGGLGRAQVSIIIAWR